MERRTFLSKTIVVALGAKSIILNSAQARSLGVYDVPSFQKVSEINETLSHAFMNLIGWMKEKGWESAVKQVSKLDLNITGPMDPKLTSKFTGELGKVVGCSDFIGDQLITPGKPAESLLYHLMASPIVRVNDDVSPHPDQYPTLNQIDLLENVIYGLDPISSEDINENSVLALFAYEYRPDFKTPHECYADMVFSRAGIARIGSQGMFSENGELATYDRVNRCFLNKPSDGNKEKEIAVTPARYGLFLATSVSASKIIDNYPQKFDSSLNYLLPKRKIFAEDLATIGLDIEFLESHLNQRLKQICQYEDIEMPVSNTGKFDIEKPPFVRRSNSSTSLGVENIMSKEFKMVELIKVGATVLLSSTPKSLTWKACQEVNGKPERVRVKIPVLSKKGIVSNRRYTSLKLLSAKDQKRDAWDTVWDYVIHPRAIITEYSAPRNAPMFVNIRDEVNEKTGETIAKLDVDYKGFNDKINQSYWVGLFEDNICDGCIFAKVNVNTDKKNLSPVAAKLLSLKVLPSFSIVTAPDFFPLIESYDLMGLQDMFLAGGIQDVSGARLKANPNITLPFSTISAFPDDSKSNIENDASNTILSIISKLNVSPSSGPNDTCIDIENVEKGSIQNRSNFLPDSATLLFYPGWDITYSSTLNNGVEANFKYYSTMGLGSPFMEDSKLCAAINGMWAAASPDAARTFRGGLTPIPSKGITPTAVPLLDIELGLHPDSPAAQILKKAPTGWDGEQGPFLKKTNTGFLVNFTDINLSDYVQNALAGRFDMSLLRLITTSEMRSRMKDLKKCYNKLKMISLKRYLWLVGVEKVINWSEGFQPSCIDSAIFQIDPQLKAAMSWKEQKLGYLFLFAKMDDGVTGKRSSDPKRLTQASNTIYICKTSNGVVDILEITAINNNWSFKWI